MKLIRKISALILVLVLALTACTFASASAASNEEFERHMKSIGRDGEKALGVNINNWGLFHVQKVKFYGRKIVGMNEDKSFILGGWELLMTDIGSLNISNRYAQFAFSFDVMWGTDFPFSRVFWTDVNAYVGDINIFIGGGCRDVVVTIDVNGDQIFNDRNCDSHREWKP